MKKSRTNQPASKCNQRAHKSRRKERQTGSSRQDEGITIVGLGASAGGLRALQAFFEALPSDTGMAFVVITHLHPEHESHLAEILQSHTRMIVNQVSGSVEVQPNHVYVTPPNRRIVLADSKLDIAEFEEPRGQRAPIDQFFRGLARSHSNSIGIILSGGGTDGAVGIKDIKEAGGLLMVQDPNEAEHDSMPRAAIATGLADVVLPVSELARKLLAYAQHTLDVPTDTDDLTEGQQQALERILAQVHARTGHDVSQYKRSTVLRRVQRRMQLNEQQSLDGYLDFLRHHSGEAASMFNDILIGVTNFFRDHESWEALSTNVLPALFAHKEAGGAIRAWTIGCSTGEEAYTLGILLLEHAGKLDRKYQIQIFASDLDDSALTYARDGLYPAAIEADVGSDRLERYFTRRDNHYEVRRELRDLVVFANHNILRDPPFSKLDLICCRNLLIYLNRETQANVLDLFHYALTPDGYLFLGIAESAESVSELFHTLDKPHRIYQARPWVGRGPHVPSLPLSVRSMRAFGAQGGARTDIGKFASNVTILEDQHRKALEEYGPPSILVDKEHRILNISQTAGRYLLQPAGPITNDLLKLVRPELQMELRPALFQAFEKRKATVSRPISVKFNGEPQRVVISVRPDRETSESEQDASTKALVFFLEDETARGEPGTPAAVETGSAVKSRDLVNQLDDEISRLRERLQVTTENHEHANEELKAANEELQSTNEEYRSAAEELETSKEELQSVNEELQTVNNELTNKLGEITRAHSDLENLMDAAKIATLFLDLDLNIQRFTPGVREVFNIRATDRGRSIADLTHSLGYEDLVQDAREALRTLSMVERQSAAANGSWFLIRLRPYYTVDKKIDGLVITFVDITEFKAAENARQQFSRLLEERVEERTRELDEANLRLTEARDLFYVLFHANPIPTALTWLNDGTFIDVNRAYLDYYGLEREAVIGHTSAELGLPLAPDVRPGLVAKVRERGMIHNRELDITKPSGESRTILASFQRINLEDSEGLISTFTDITERARAEQQVRAMAIGLSAAEQIERHRISRILHDDLQQNIFAVKMQLMFLSEAIERKDLERLQVDIQQLDQWLAEAVATTRQLSVDLSPPILQGEGLAEAFIWLAAQFKEQYGLDIIVDVKGGNPTLGEDVRALIFQAVRELLFNVVKHSGTLKANLTIEGKESQINIIVSDQGRGFDGTPLSETSGASHGLTRMRDRLSLFGCSLVASSEPDHGAQVRIEVPIENNVV